MPHGKRWKVSINWIDGSENEATTEYHISDAQSDVVNVVADSMAKFCKATYHPTIIATYVDMNCYNCGYESEKEPYFSRTYVCNCEINKVNPKE